MKNFISGFFPDFPDPVFSRKKTVRGHAQSQTMSHFVDFVTKFHHISPSVCGGMWSTRKMQKTCFFRQKLTFLGLIIILDKNVFNKNCSQLKTKNFKKIFFSGIPDPVFHPDSTFSGFFEFFESMVHMDHFCRRIFELYQMVDL